VIAKSLVKRGILEAEITKPYEGEIGTDPEAIRSSGGNSRSKATRLKEGLGWEIKIQTSVFESVEDEMDAILDS
jgi:hypothetical protein